MNSLEQFLTESDLTKKGVKIHSFSSSTHTATEAADLLKCSPDQIIKSLVIIVETATENLPYLVLVPGPKKLRQVAIRRLLKEKCSVIAEDSRLATAEEVLTLTGFHIGGVPPFTNLQTIADESIRIQKVLFGGGGSPTTLLEIPTELLLQHTKPILGQICSQNT